MYTPFFSINFSLKIVNNLPITSTEERQPECVQFCIEHVYVLIFLYCARIGCWKYWWDPRVIVIKEYKLLRQSENERNKSHHLNSSSQDVESELLLASYVSLQFVSTKGFKMQTGLLFAPEFRFTNPTKGAT